LSVEFALVELIINRRLSEERPMRTRTLTILLVLITAALPVGVVSAEPTPPLAYGWGQYTVGQWRTADHDQTASAIPTWTAAGAGQLDDTRPPFRAIVELDVDRDGDVDLAAGDSSSAGYLYLNDGAGSFASVSSGNFTMPFGQVSTEAMIALDADNDGDMDVVRAVHQNSGSSFLVLYANDDRGQLTSRDSGNLEDGAGHAITALALADVDQDGDLDLAVGASPYSRLYLNNGHGVFQRVEAGGFDDESADVVKPLDADGDGDLDLVCISSWRGKLYLNDGVGVFTEAAAGDFTRHTRLRSLNTLDANSDGDMDLVVSHDFGANSPYRFAIYANDGSAHFDVVPAGDIDTFDWTINAIGVFDAEGDGDSDLVVEGPAIFVNDGRGHFTKEPPEQIDGRSAAVRHILTFDVNGDHSTDLVFSSNQFGSALFLNRLPDPTCISLAPIGYQTAFQFGPDVFYAMDAAAFDVDGDGDIDLAQAGSGNALWRNDGAGRMTLSDAGEFDDATTASNYTLAAFDADGDGDIDLATTRRDLARTVLFLNNGSGSFTRADAGDLDDVPSEAQVLAAFDADGDGDMDLAVVDSMGTSSGMHINDGTGRFSRMNAGTLSQITRANDLAPFDADGDGDIDLALAQPDRGMLLMNDGTGLLSSAYAGDFGWGLLYLFDIEPVDVDGDHDIDLATVFGAYSPRYNLIFTNNGAGLFTITDSGVFDDSRHNSASVAALDVDSDGDMDLAVGNGMYSEEGEELSNLLFLNDGTGRFTFGPEGHFQQKQQQTAKVLSFDSNGDARPDLAVFSQGPNWLYHSTAGGALVQAEAGEFDDSAYTGVAITLDANGDGIADVALGKWGTNELLLGSTDGELTPALAGDFSARADDTRALIAGDFDLDGDVDLAEGNFDAPNALYLNNGAGLFTRIDAGGFDDQIRKTLSLAAFDADRDGDVDLAVGGLDQRSLLFMNDGTGRLNQVESGQFDDEIVRAYAIEAFDADVDGDIDLALANNRDVSAGTVTRNRLFLNNGFGAFFTTEAGDFDDPDATQWQIRDLAVFDLDDDGDLDLVQAAHGDEIVYHNDDAGRFSRFFVPGLSDGSGYTNSLLPVDIDNDGDVDLVVDDLGLFLNDGAGGLVHAKTGDFPRQANTLATLDVDLDGDLDLFEGRTGHDLLYLYQGLAETGRVTSPAVTPGQLHPLAGEFLGWRVLVVNETAPQHTALTYDVLDGVTNSAIPGYTSLRPDATGRVDLAGLNPGVYPAIRLRANLADLDAGPDFNDRTPQLCAWTVTFDMAQGSVRFFPIAPHHAALPQ
jgi:hypothetical protein